MFRLIPAPLHRAAYRAAHELRRRWWRITGAQLVGCRVLAFDARGQLLLVRHSYGSQRWMLPGGGVGRKESPIAAAQRELEEETGCKIRDPYLVTMVDEPLYGTTNRVFVVGGWFHGTPRCDGREVVEAALFDPGDLPADMPPRLLQQLPEWIAAFLPSDTDQRV